MKDIEGYEGLYAITSCGKIWSYRSKKFLKPKVDKYGYYQVGLYKEKVEKWYTVHRLVAMTYIPNPLNLETVDHIDECKTHNYINNLQWMSRAENIAKRNRSYFNSQTKKI